MLTYAETVQYLFALKRFGVKLGLDAITTILRRLNNPQHQYPTLHIAGTNGKGSSAAMVAAVLQAGGYRVGLYTSPHLIDFRERIRVQDDHIAEKHVCVLTESIRALVDPVSPLTFFEFTTALAFQYFFEQQVDIAVIEVGLGGRFDATNVLHPLGILITGIGMDHEKHLGSTIQDIAREKAGVMQRNVPVVLGEMVPSVREIFERIAQDHDAPCYRYGKEFSIASTSQRMFTYNGLQRSLVGLHTNLLGRHQMKNAACAMALVESAVTNVFPLSPEAMQNGLQHVRWSGRLQVIRDEPMVVLDGAHNSSGARVLFDFLQTQLHDCAGRKLVVVLGMMQDKNHVEYLKILLPLIDSLIVTQPQMSRALMAQELWAVVQQLGFQGVTVENSWEAYGKALEMARPGDLICITGSLFLVGEILQRVALPNLPRDTSLP